MDRICGIIIFFLGAGILWQGRVLPVGSLRRPGSGFFPTLMAIGLMMLSLFLVVPRAKEEQKQPVSGKATLRIVIVFAGLLAYFFLLESLGFIVTSFLLMAFLFIAFGAQRAERWHIAVFRALIVVGLAYVVFDLLLEGNLPKGVFGF